MQDDKSGLVFNYAFGDGVYKGVYTAFLIANSLPRNNKNNRLPGNDTGQRTLYRVFLLKSR